MFRREAWALLGAVYRDVRLMPSQGTFPLSRAAQEEMLVLTLSAPLLRRNMRCNRFFKS